MTVQPDPTHSCACCSRSAGRVDRGQGGAVSRRSIAGLVGITAVGVPLLAACGASSSAPDSASTSTGDSAGETTTTSGSTSSGSGSTSGPLATTDEIEVGGGKIFSDAGVVVTQPTSGEFKAFSSTCTHQGCQVSSVKDGSIDCPCHGSEFSIADGSVQAGPAPSALPEMKLTVTGTQISLA